MGGVRRRPRWSPPFEAEHLRPRHVASTYDDLACAVEAPAVDLRRLIEVLNGRLAPGLPLGTELPVAGHRPFIVFVDFPDAPGPSVEFDLEGSSLLAATHLIEHGHRRIGYLTPALQRPNVAPKYAGFRRALEEAGLAPDPELVASVRDFTIEAGYQGTVHLLDHADPPTGIVAANDALALGAMHAVISRGLRIPDDIALVGNDDIDMAAIVRPALTTVALPTRQAGIQATTMLQQLIAGHPPKPTRQVLTTHLVIRETCGCHISSPSGGDEHLDS